MKKDFFAAPDVKQRDSPFRQTLKFPDGEAASRGHGTRNIARMDTCFHYSYRESQHALPSKPHIHRHLAPKSTKAWSPRPLSFRSQRPPRRRMLRRQSYEANSLTGTQLQNRFLSPYTLSTRPTGDQYLACRSAATGKAAVSRL